MKSTIKAEDLLKMSEASVIRHGAEKTLEKDPKAKAVIKAYKIANEYMDRISEILKSIEAVVEGGAEGLPKYEIVETTVKKKAGKNPGERVVFIFENPHTGEIEECKRSGNHFAVSPRLGSWFKAFGPTEVRNWLTIKKENEKGA